MTSPNESLAARVSQVRRLVDTRTVLISPMTNAVGSAQRTRTELGIDPNRDFPFDQSPRACMQTVTARTVNELYRSHLLQLVITFHGGMQVSRPSICCTSLRPHPSFVITSVHYPSHPSHLPANELFTPAAAILCCDRYAF
jgi:hypothetical protein